MSKNDTNSGGVIINNNFPPGGSTNISGSPNFGYIGNQTIYKKTDRNEDAGRREAATQDDDDGAQLSPEDASSNTQSSRRGDRQRASIVVEDRGSPPTFPKLLVDKRLTSASIGAWGLVVAVLTLMATVVGLL